MITNLLYHHGDAWRCVLVHDDENEDNDNWDDDVHLFNNIKHLIVN